MAPKKAHRISTAGAAIAGRTQKLKSALMRKALTGHEVAQLLECNQSTAFSYLHRAGAVASNRKRMNDEGTRHVTTYVLPDVSPLPGPQAPAPVAPSSLTMADGNLVMMIAGEPWEVKLVRRLR